MAFALNRVVKLEDFEEPVVRDAIREIFAREAAMAPEFPTGQEHRKQWEVAMAVLALRDGGVLRPDAEVLGIGAGSEATLFWLTNYVRRVFATDLYADPGTWIGTAPPTMLTNPGSAWNGPWNPRRLVVQHMDACELAYEDETFDGIFSSGSIEHFGGLERIGIAMDEAFRVLKPGGTASFSTEFLVEGDPLEFEDDMVMFTPELIERFLVGDRDWAPMTPIDYTLTDATLATEIDECRVRCPRRARRVGISTLRAAGRVEPHHERALRAAQVPTQPRPLPVRARIDAPDTASRTAGRNRCGSLRALSRSRALPWRGRYAAAREQPTPGVNLKRVARRLARPVLSPIDGRVADINRRVEITRRDCRTLL